MAKRPKTVLPADKQRGQTLATLDKERDVLAAIAEIAGALIVVLSKNGKVIFFNRACAETTGYSAEEMKGKHIWDLIVPAEEIESTKAVYAKLKSGGSQVTHENHWIAKDGSQRLITWSSTAYPSNSGDVQYIIGTGLDITDKYTADQELLQRTHDLGERVKELGCLYGISRLREQKELTLEQVLKHVVELIPPAWHYPEITCARVLLKDQVFKTTNFKETKWTQSSDIIASGECVGAVEVYYLKRRRTLAEGPFLAEERALLDAIAERLGRVVEMKERQERIIEYQLRLRQLASELFFSEERERRRLATQLHDQVGQTLALARIKLGELSEVAPNELVDDVTELVNKTIQETRSLTIELSPPVLHEVGPEGAIEWLVNRLSEQHGIVTKFKDDKSSKPLSDDIRVVLFQAVGELLHNIVKHAKASLVEVHVARTNDDIHIEVKDDGVGFDSTDVVSRAGKEGAFGLFNIRERLNYVGGRVAVASEIGKGTRVTLTAPLDLSEEAVPIGTSGEKRSAVEKCVRVLLVDDHQIIREGLQALLEKHADIAVVAEAASGEEATRLARELTPDVVVMDVAMPEMGGIEATKQITGQLPDTRVIALSMHSDVQFVLEMLRAGASGYLLKDSAQEDLAHAIRIVNSQLTFISHGIAGNVIENYIQRLGTSKAAAQEILTPREQEVLKLLTDGLNTKQVASRLEVSVKTIEAHRQHIMEKLGMQSIADLTKYAIREGLTKLDP